MCFHGLRGERVVSGDRERTADEPPELRAAPPPPASRRAAALAALGRLHAAVDARAAALAARHAARLGCRRGCSGCCVDGITVFTIEAERIRARHAALLASGMPHAPGGCAFLDAEGACRIYPDRPYVCRTQGLPLRWIDEERGLELRDICPINVSTEPLESLSEDACWTIGEVEAELADLQRAFGVEGERIALRALFAA
jgi:Fe-S-cluster containining protein